jgi:hypothetical protein
MHEVQSAIYYMIMSALTILTLTCYLTKLPQTFLIL